MKPKKSPSLFLNFIIRSAVVLAILLGAVTFGKMLIRLKKPTVGRPPPEVIPQVETLAVVSATHHPSLTGYGIIQSWFETTLTPQVSGRVVEVAACFRVGQKITADQLLVRIEDSDYQAALAAQKANLALQQRALAEEEILAQQAVQDWQASGRDPNSAPDFALRKPQLAAARAQCASAEAAVSKAEADVQRTRITAPYDAIVTERTASPGNFATAQISLGKLVATARAEVRIPLTAEQMARIALAPEDQPIFTLTLPDNQETSWRASFTQIEPVVDSRNQVSYLIATIEDPYAEEGQPLPVGSFVNVALPAHPIENAYKIPETALVNDAYFWAVDADNLLQRVEATRVQSSGSFAYVTLEAAEPAPVQLVTRPLSTFRPGMRVQQTDN